MVLKWAILVNFHCSEILGTLMVHIEQQHGKHRRASATSSNKSSVGTADTIFEESAFIFRILGYESGLNLSNLSTEACIYLWKNWPSLFGSGQGCQTKRLLRL